MDTRIQKMRQRLAKHQNKIADMQAQAVEMEQEIKNAEDEHLGYLARSVANTLSGGMDEVFELLQELRSRPNKPNNSTNIPSAPTTAENYINNERNGEVVSLDSADDKSKTE